MKLKVNHGIENYDSEYEVVSNFIPICPFLEINTFMKVFYFNRLKLSFCSIEKYFFFQ